MYQTVGFKMTGSERRAAKRAGEVSALTRAEACALIQTLTTFDECKRVFDEHKSNRVKRSAMVRALALGTNASLTDYDRLVIRFRKEGKANPEKSARASIAARAQVRKRTEQATLNG